MRRNSELALRAAVGFAAFFLWPLNLYSGELPRVPLGGDYWKGKPASSTQGRQSLWGIADLHAHFFNHLGFGGRVFHGKVYSPLGAEDALQSCEENHGSDGFGGVTSVTPEFGHRSSGWPTFEGWPKYSTLVHQHAYVDWIRRAWEGGLRLVQMDAGNSKFLSVIYRTANPLLSRTQASLPDDDAQALRNQIDAAREFVTSGPGAEFAEIAYSPKDARRIISSGKLAIVLGIEVETLGNMIHNVDLGPDPRKAIRRELKALYEIGVRHIFPVHLTSNAFGSPAVYERIFNTNNFTETGEWFKTREGFDSGLRLNMRMVPADPISWVAELVGFWGPGASAPAFKSEANASGLTPYGEIALEEMMKLGILIDIDHMSDLAANQTLEMAEAQDYPVMSSHTGFRDLSFGAQVEYGKKGFQVKQPSYAYNEKTAPLYGTSDPRKVSNERNRSREQMARIEKLGGMVGLGLVGSGNGTSWRDRIPLDCDGTSKSFAQAFQYAVEVMKGHGVALGSDVNGLAGLPSPRFGLEACAGLQGDAIRNAGRRIRAQALAQRSGVRYDSPISNAQGWRFLKAGTDWAFDPAEQEIWEAIAYFKAGVDINQFDPRAGMRTAWSQKRIRSIARGFSLAARRKPASETDDDQRAAYEAYSGREFLGAGRDRILKIWRLWQEMESGDHPPLKRYRLGKREFDVNLDGMAHYGLLPDFLQDLVNVGVSPDQLSPLFQSAEDYVQMWEKAERNSKRDRKGQKCNRPYK